LETAYKDLSGLLKRLEAATQEVKDSLKAVDNVKAIIMQMFERGYLTEGFKRELEELGLL